MFVPPKSEVAFCGTLVFVAHELTLLSPYQAGILCECLAADVLKPLLYPNSLFQSPGWNLEHGLLFCFFYAS